MIKRSISIEGAVTSISLEPVFWEEVDRRATIKRQAWQLYIRRLLENLPEGVNRSSAIRAALLNDLKKEVLRLGARRHESWWLIKIPGNRNEIGLRGTLLFAGRNSGNDIILADAEVSRKHLMLAWDGQKWWAVDLDSKNGTYFKGKKMTTARLKKGDRLHLGRCEIVLEG